VSNRIIDVNQTSEDDDISLRPLRLVDYVGQEAIKEKLS
jgi:Holliday junction resolvasome RuvABC ATP-dependent DNA helicase subunit